MISPAQSISPFYRGECRKCGSFMQDLPWWAPNWLHTAFCKGGGGGQ